MSDNYLTMLSIKCFICSLFLWLAFFSPMQIEGNTAYFEKPLAHITASSDTNYNALIVDNHLNTHRVNWSSKTFKIPYSALNNKFQQSIVSLYDCKLLYVKIGNVIPLHFTSRTLIFPFHSFT